MSLDATARASNIRDSIKKYMIDNLYTTEGVELLFDKDLSTPSVQGHAIEKWVTINFGDTDRPAGWLILTCYCCTRKDSEGFKLAQLTDKVLGYLSDNTQTGGLARVPLYQSSPSGPWTLIGSFTVIIEGESQQLTTDDGTKFVIINCRFKWANKF